jgi:hypothetical protein
MRRAFFASIAVAVVACSQILGIEDAERDPLLGTGTGAAGGGTGGDAGAGGQADLCPQYCDTIMQSCTEGNAQYPDLELCLLMCSHLPQTPGTDGVNNVACRLNSAELAGTSEPEAECPVAGPSGNDVCGLTCEAYCLLLEAICPGEFGDTFSSITDCRSECALVPTGGPYNASFFEGPTLNCRLYHLTVATKQPGTHCPHAAAISGPCIGMGGSGGTGGGGGAGGGG